MNDDIKLYRPVYDVTWGARFERELDDYMTELQNSVDGEDDVETLSGEPFCGCSDCCEREYLLMAVALTLQGVDFAAVRPKGWAYQIDREANHQMAQHGLAKNEVHRLRDIHDFGNALTCWGCGVTKADAERTAATYDA